MIIVCSTDLPNSEDTLLTRLLYEYKHAHTIDSNHSTLTTAIPVIEKTLSNSGHCFD